MSLLIGGKRLAWKRYWVPWDGNIYTEGRNSGFIREPTGKWGRISNPHLQTVEEILDRPFLVLSGAPGMGKTQAVEQLSQSWPQISPDESLIHVEGRTLDSSGSVYRETTESNQWKTAVQTGRRIRLLIDGVDEAILRRIDLTTILRQALKDQPLELIRVILVCRAAEWDADEGNRFSLLWQAIAPWEPSDTPSSSVKPTGPDLKTALVWELCPLCRSDAETAASASGCDPKAFLEAVARRDVEGLAARPVTLKMLLARFTSNPAFTSSFRDIYYDSILELCGEVNEERKRYARPYPPKSKVYRLASRLAATLLFARKSIIVKSGTGSKDLSSELGISEMEGEDVVDGQRFTIDRELIDFTLDTPLFNFRGPNYGFEQKTYSEFLAAEYLKTGSVDQLKSLFCATVSGHAVVAPYLAEVAAWAALYHTEWFCYLCENDPEILLRADLSSCSHEQKRLAVRHLLKAAADEKAFDQQGLDRFYSTWSHPSIAGQLRPYICNPSFNLVARRMAISLAGECRVKALEKDLWKRAKANDPSIQWIGYALQKLTGPHAKKLLVEVLERKFPPSTYRVLGGMALRVLVPRIFSVTEVLPFLTKRGPTGNIDSYHIASNYHLREHIKPGDLVPALRWIKGIKDIFDLEHTLHSLAQHILQKAMMHFNDPSVRKETVAIWLKCLKSRRALPRPFGESEEKADIPLFGEATKAELQRQLAAVLVNTGSLRAFPRRYQLLQTLVGYRDLPWMLDQLDKAKPSRVDDWARICGWYLRFEESAKFPDLVNAAYTRYREMQKALPPPEPGMDIVSSLGVWERRGREEFEEHSRQNTVRRPKRQSRDEIIEKLLAKRNSKSIEWVTLSGVLRMREANDPVRQTRSHNLITASPGWQAASPATQVSVRGWAVRFLLHCRDKEWKPGQETKMSDAAYRAIRLVFPDLAANPRLANAIRSHWPHAIFDAFRDDDPDFPTLIKWIYPDQSVLGIAILLSRMKNAEVNGMADYPLEPFTLCWDKRLRRAVVSFILSTAADHRSIFGIMNWLKAHDPEGAEDLVQKSGVLKGPLPTSARGLFIAVSAWLLLPSTNWSSMMPRISGLPKKTLKPLLEKTVAEFSQGHWLILGNFSDQQLADFGILLFRLFPSYRFPGYDRVGVVSEIREVDRIADLRRAITGILIARGSQAASDALMTIAKAAHLKDRLWIKWSHLDAERSAADKLVPGRQPGEIVLLLRSSQSALIDTADDLVEVIVESLRRLERKLKSHPSEWRALWNETDHTYRKKRLHTSGLAPKPEAALSDVVAQWLREDLSLARGMVVNREVEISKNKVLDLKIDVLAKTEGPPLVVTIECKRCTGSDVKTGLRNQLVDRYLVPHGLTHGIYLVGWYRGAWKPPQRPAWNPSSLEAARKEAHAWERAILNPDIRVRAQVLDCTGLS